MEPVAKPPPPNRRRERAKATCKERQAMREPDITPDFPASGQAIGFFIKSLDFPHKRLRTKTASRYFSGSIDSIVLEKSRTAIFDAVAEVLIQVGAIPLRDADGEREIASSIADAIRIQASYWDALKTFLRPRMPQINPDNLAKVYAACARLVAIDLSLRVGAYWRITGFAPPEDGLQEDWISRDTRGKFLNRKREEAGLTVERFAELTGVSRNSVDGWLYKGARPSDGNIVKIASALTHGDKSASRGALANEIRRFYWFADVAELAIGLIGKDAAEDITRRVCQYAAWTNSILEDVKRRAGSDGESSAYIFASRLLLGGTSTKESEVFLEVLERNETDAEWKLDLKAAAGDWLRRIVSVGMDVYNEEVDDLIASSGGRLLDDWDVSSPQAYAIYQRSMEFAMRGEFREAIAEVEKAAKLDPNDPANHFSLGSALAGIGNMMGDESVMNRAMDECWLAVRLDPNWILPWTEIGWIHILNGRHREARDHLLNVRDDCGPLNLRYWQVLGMAHLELGEMDEALAAFESGLALEPNDKGALVGAFRAASALGDAKRRRKYRKALRHIGMDDSTISLLSK